MTTITTKVIQQGGEDIRVLEVAFDIGDGKELVWTFELPDGPWHTLDQLIASFGDDEEVEIAPEDLIGGQLEDIINHLLLLGVEGL